MNLLPPTKDLSVSTRHKFGRFNESSENNNMAAHRKVKSSLKTNAGEHFV